MIGTKPKFAKITTAMAVCLTSYVTDQGVFHQGDRVRADSAELTVRPIFWANDGLTTEESHELRQQRWHNPDAA